MDETEPKEQSLASSPPPKKTTISLQQAVDFGEYDPKYLSNFPEWHDLSGHIQWQLIRKALDNRQRQLITQYAELNNTLNFSKKPAVREACKSMEKQLTKLAEDREKLYVEYSNKF